jgi:subtilase family serine protease
MTIARRRVRWVATVGAVITAVGLVMAAPGTASASVKPALAPYTVHPLVKQFSHGTPAALPVTSQCVALVGLACYTPAQIRKAYDIPANFTGKGEKIAIVDAYGSPTAAADLANFSAVFGLPAADLHIYCAADACAWPTGGDELTLAENWAFETSLDIQWAHAIAPLATINLVVSPTPDNGVMNDAVQYVVTRNLGDVLSMSWGTDEADNNPATDNDLFTPLHNIFTQAAANGISLFASAGDGGAADGWPHTNASYPASDPLVTSVGGTNLFADDKGNYQNETVWNDFDPSLCPFGCTEGIFGATGGSVSTFFNTPAYQVGVTHQSGRAVADVSYNASVYTAVWVSVGFFSNPDDNGFYFSGGTSSGSPQWAAIGALADQKAGHRLGQLNPLLYAIASKGSYNKAFHDVTVGNNAFFGPGFNAGKGWDIPTGLGSPDVGNLIGALVK